MAESPETRVDIRPPMISEVPDELIPLGEKVEASWSKSAIGYTGRSVPAWYEMGADARETLIGDSLTLMEAGAALSPDVLASLKDCLNSTSQSAWFFKRRNEDFGDHYSKVRKLEDRLRIIQTPRDDQKVSLADALPQHPSETTSQLEQGALRRALGYLAFWR